MNIREKVSEACKKKILFTTHALNQMNSPERMISKEDVRNVITKGEIIEDYPDDPRGPSCLMIGKIREERIVHVVCSPTDEYLAIITAYIPGIEKWEDDLKTRKISKGNFCVQLEPKALIRARRK